eukprot:TRINITY_DN5208_c1_g1_i1.p1 TRINITY_DN5208_c1_g1~~TRINITY_DN5208_c1_g1_i1.p1  ORF type:complete len:223 (+),score=16.02 TRINITY_DN5208_c1_g1_i1:117-785(+)
MSMTTRKTLAKVIVLGNSFVGKTSVLLQYVSGRFQNQYKANIGADFWTKEISVSGNLVTLQLWDTAGQERFNSMGSAFYRGADCCVLVFDVTNRDSFKALDEWKKDFIIQSSVAKPDEFPFIVIGNKIDLDDKRVVSYQEAKDWCGRNNVPYFETSAKNNLQVEQAFAEAGKVACRHSNEIFVVPDVFLDRDRNPKFVKTCVCYSFNDVNSNRRCIIKFVYK